MSRLIVKGLPRHLSEDRLRTHFAAAGEVTDAKIRLTHDGRSRQFGFVGFRKADDAQQARRMFNRTFLDTSKLSVEVAQPYGNDAIPRAWSKYTKGSSRYQKLHPSEHAHTEPPQQTAVPKGKGVSGREAAHEARETTVAKEKKKDEEDTKFLEFLSVAQPRQKKKIWADDGDAAAPVPVPHPSDRRKERTPTDGREPTAAMGEKKILVKSKKAGGEGLLLTRTHVTFDDDDDDADNETASEEPRSSTAAAALEENAARKKQLSDMDYLRANMTSSFSEDDGRDDELDDADEDEEDDGGREAATEIADMQEGNAGGSEMVDPEGPGGEGAGTPPPSKVPTATDAADARARRSDEDGEAVEPVSESGRLFVRNLPYTATEEDLEELFEKFGALAEVHLCVDKVTKQSKGMAFVLYVLPENAASALAEVDGTIFMGRLVHILPARRRPVAAQGEGEEVAEGDDGENGGAAASRRGGGRASSFQREKAKERSAAAKSRSDIVAYNPLFMHADAVASALADRYDANKSDIFGDENAAVRLAAGEAQLQEEARDVLKTEGVNVEAFSMMDKVSMKTKRSKTVMMVKNLPAGTADPDIRDRFAKFGLLGRVVMVPSGLIALVEFLDQGDARRAYNSIAYTRFRDRPLYLEWAPLQAFTTTATTTAAGAPSTPSITTPASSATSRTHGGDASARPRDVKDDHGDGVGEGTAVAGERGGREEGADPDTTTVFVKNLNFSTDDEALKRAFHKSTQLRSARVARRKIDNKSLGFGFLEFQSKEEARRVVRIYQGRILDEHALELKLSATATGAGRKRGRQEVVAGGGTDAERTPSREGKSAKLLVKNLAFEASQREVRKLFSTYGELKSVKLPRKFDGSHRGFAFVEFKSKTEAAAAKQQLRTTHFYARRLVLEYAHEDDELGAGLAAVGGGTGSSARRSDAAAAEAAMENRMEIEAKRLRPSKRRKQKQPDGGAGNMDVDANDGTEFEMYS